MLTTLMMKKEEYMGDIKNQNNMTYLKNTNRNSFYNSYNTLIKKETRTNIMSANPNRTNQKISANFFKNSQSVLKNTFSKKKSFEATSDLSMSKSPPENKFKSNLLGNHKKGKEMKEYKFDLENNNNQKMKKLKSMDFQKPSEKVDKKELIFDKIYSFNSEFMKLVKQLQNKKYDSLYEYQNQILRLVADKTSMDNLRILSQKLKTIRDINDSYTPVNSVNWKLFERIIRDFKDQIDSIRNGTYIADNGGESEVVKHKELFIKQLDIQKRKQVSLNKKFSKYESTMKRISPYIPEYLVEKFNKSLKIIN